MSLTKNFDNLGKNDEGDKPESEEDIVEYGSHGNVRKLCFVLADGSREFMNYAFLVKGKFMPEENTITLIYTTDIVTLKGLNLENLFDSLEMDMPKKIVCTDKRYISMKNKDEVVVTEIGIVEKK